MVIGGIANVKPWTAQALAQRMVRRALITRGSEEPPGLVFSVNGEAVARNARDPGFARLMREADIVHPDGMSTVWASRLFYRRGARERVATTDFIWPVSREAARNGVSFFLLGGRPGVAEAAGEALRAQVPGLRIAGTHHGFYAMDEEPEVIERIRAAQPDIVWVGLGRPHQEAFCVRNREALAGVTWLKTCGGLYAFLTGESRRAPALLQRSGLEWLYRACREPRRLGKRYLTTNGPGLYHLLTATARRPANGASAGHPRDDEPLAHRK